MGIQFTKNIALIAFEISGGECKCGQQLIWNKRSFNGPGGWEVYPFNKNGLPTLDNCELLCTRCYKARKSQKKARALLKQLVKLP